jgi:hypothetical protein
MDFGFPISLIKPTAAERNNLRILSRRILPLPTFFVPLVLCVANKSSISPGQFVTRLRIAYVIPTLDQSGAEKQLTLLAELLPREEFEPHVIALTRGGPYAERLQAAGLPVTVLGKRWKFDPFAWRSLARALRQLQPDIVHTWLFAANTYGRYALPRRPRPKVIVSERCVDSWKAGWQLGECRRLLRSIGIAQGQAARHSQRCGVAAATVASRTIDRAAIAGGHISDRLCRPTRRAEAGP